MRLLTCHIENFGKLSDSPMILQMATMLLCCRMAQEKVHLQHLSA